MTPRLKKNISSRAAVLPLIVLILSATLKACDDSTRDNPDLERERWEFLQLTAPPDARAACEANQTSALECADAAGGGGAGGAVVQEQYVIALETIYGITVGAPRKAGEICAVLPDSPNFPVPGGSDKTYATGAKVCFFSCDKDYWERARSGGLCTPVSYAALSPAGDAIVQDCVKDCLIRGTVLP